MDALLIQSAREWIGTPRHDGQAVKYHGCDCVGFLIGVAKEIGYLPMDAVIPNYSQVARGNQLIETLDKFLDRDSSGIIVTMQYSGIITHVGIVDGDRLIHSDRKKGVIPIPFTAYMQSKARIRYSLRWLS